MLAGGRGSGRSRRGSVLSWPFRGGDRVAPDPNGPTSHTRHQDSQGATDMSRYPDNDTSFQAGDWLAGAARRNPEGLLLLAAGACLLMRSRGSASSRSPVRSQYRDIDYTPPSGSGRIASSAGRTASDVR